MHHSDHTRFRPAAERGTTDLGWLQSSHSFSFGGYSDPEHVGFRSLRVINDDRVAGGMGFGMHPHRDMEILSYVVSGALTHKDSLGNEETVEAGGIQYMSAGSGVRHSEFNASASEAVHFLQIWITPDERNAAPRYAEWRPSTDQGLILAASADGRDNSLAIRQQADVYLGRMSGGESRVHQPRGGTWIQIIEGGLTVNSQDLAAGDGISFDQSDSLSLTAGSSVQFLLFDLE